jgi:protein TonB
MKSKLFSFKSIALIGITMLYVATGVAQNNSKSSDCNDPVMAKMIGEANMKKMENKTPDVTVNLSNKENSESITVQEAKVSIAGSSTTKEVEIKDANTPYYTVNEMPVYVCGKKELPNYISRTAKYPKEAIKDKAQGVVIVQIVVEKNGSISNPQVITSVHPKLDEEALRVVNTLQGFTPGKHNGETVRCYYQIPVPFVLLEPKK